VRALPEEIVEGAMAELDIVINCARRAEQIFSNISEAHQLGCGPGTRNDPWTVAYQKRAVVVSSHTLPPSFQINIARSFNAALLE